MKPRLEISFSWAQKRAFLFGTPYVPERDEFLLNHARSGILLALKALQLPTGSGVGVMVYNCHTVMNAIDQAGCKPVFLDVDDDLTLDLADLQKKVEGISAIVVTHLFGIVNDVKKIKELYPHLRIIEDCAHAYGIDQFYGDFATFSIGQGKMPSIGDGGILKVINSQYKSIVAGLYDSLPGYTAFQNVKLFLKLSMMSLMHSRYLYGWVTLPLKRRRSVPSGKESILSHKMSRRISAVYARVKESVPERIARGQSNANVLKMSLPAGVNHAMLGSNAFMLVMDCQNPEYVKESFLRLGVDTDTHFAHSIHWAREFGYIQGQCPNAEKLVNHLLMVPIY